MFQVFFLCFLLSAPPARLTLQRLRDAIDSRIAEEQARSKSAQDSISRSNSARRPPSRALSPSKRTRPRRNTSSTPGRGPDPTEFEAEFAIGDDDSSRSGTPRVDSPAPTDNQAVGENGDKSSEQPGKDAVPESQSQGNQNQNQAPSELPPEIRVKLRRLDKMESRYHGMFGCLV